MKQERELKGIFKIHTRDLYSSQSHFLHEYLDQIRPIFSFIRYLFIPILLCCDIPRHISTVCLLNVAIKVCQSNIVVRCCMNKQDTSIVHLRTTKMIFWLDLEKKLRFVHSITLVMRD